MISVWEQIHQILTHTSTLKGKAKKEYIESVMAGDSDNHELKIALRLYVGLVLDPDLSYYLKQLPEVITKQASLFGFGVEAKYTMDDFLSKMMVISGQGSAKAVDKVELAEILAHLTEKERVLCTNLIDRNLRCGVGLSVWRNIFGPEFCPPFEYALMGSFDEPKITKLINFSKGAISQLKSDGLRCIITKRDGVLRARSRNNKEIVNIDSIISEVSNIGADGDFDIDGELVVMESLAEDSPIMDRKSGNGIINKKKRSVSETVRIRFVVWDLIEHDNEPVGYMDRFTNLQRLTEKLPHITPTEFKVVWSLTEAKMHYLEMVNRGEEGTVLKDRDSLWTPGENESCRNANGFKFKEVHPGDFVIVGWYYGKKNSKYEELIGGLECESRCGQVKFNVGSGLTDEMRKSDPESFIGKVAQCLYNARILSESSNRDNNVYSLFTPRIDEIRTDKSAEDADDLDKLITQEESSRQVKEF